MCLLTEMLLQANSIRRPYSFVLAINNRWLFLQCIQCPMSSKRRTNTNDERHSVQQHFRYNLVVLDMFALQPISTVELFIDINQF